MCEALNKAFPLQHIYGWDAFDAWEEAPFRDVEHFAYRSIADRHFANIRDSVSRIHNSYKERTDYLLQHIAVLDYNTLKDSLAKLPAEPPHAGSNRYFSTVVDELARKRPELFLRLAEEYPDKRDMIFIAVKRKEEVARLISEVHGYEPAKKAFLK